MATCPSCRTTYPDDHRNCPADGSELLPDAAFANADEAIGSGTQIGEYEVEGLLGEGGFGAVYAAVQPLIGKRVAIKVLKREFSSNPQMASRFISEARAVNQIQHRYIIDIFSFGQLEDGRHYYVMDLLEGKPLDAHLGARGRFSLEEGLPILRAIAEAVDAAHNTGIAHRDLKPENVFVTKSGSIKLLDFGIAKLSGDGTQHKTQTGAAMGTPYFMSPEQCRGRNVDHRTDIYAFGIMTYQLLTGQLPFVGDDMMEIMMQQISATPAAPSKVSAEVPLQLDGPILAMMAKDPDERPPSMMDGIEAVIRAATDAGKPVPKTLENIAVDPDSAPRLEAGARMASTMAHGEMLAATDAPPRSRGRTIGIAAAAVAVCAAAAVAFFLQRGDSSKDQSGQTASSETGEIEERELVDGDDSAVEVTPDAAVKVAESPADAAAPTAPATIRLEIQDTPKGTEVVGPDGKVLGTAPGAIELPRSDESIELTFRARGYRTESKAITPSSNMLLPLSMTKKKKTRPRRDPDRPKKPDVDDIEEAF